MYKKIRTLLYFICFAHVTLSAQDKPIPFIENKGQWPTQVIARAEVPGGNLYIEKGGITFDFYNTLQAGEFWAEHIHPSDKPVSSIIKCHNYKVTFENSAQDYTISKQYPSNNTYNYFKGSDPSKWGSGAKAYLMIDLENIYPGITARYYSNSDYIKYDLVVKPGADPRNICLRYDHADNLSIDKQGNLFVKTSVNDITEIKPWAFQVISGDTIEVPCRYHLKNNKVTYVFPDGYNRKYTLVIDPTLKFSTYSGSVADNFGYTASFDIDGFLYSAGSVFDQGYPTTPGAYETDFKGIIDIGLTKYDTTGTKLIYSTYIGGASVELPHSLIVNQDNELYLYGTTSSSDYPVAGNPYQTTFRGGTDLTLSGVSARYNKGSDIVVTKVSSNGTALLASTFVGGTSNDGLNASSNLSYNYADQLRGEILLDENGNCYVVSSTYSNDFPVTSQVFQTVRDDKQEGVVFKLNPTLSAMLWGSFLGGSGDDACYSLDFTKDNQLVIAGGTTSSNLKTTGTALQKTFGGGRADGFIALVNNDGQILQYLTYWGSDQYDQIYQLEIDKLNNKYVVGQTEDKGTKFYDGTVYGQPNSGQFITKFKPDLEQVNWTTTFGKGDKVPNISPVAFLVDGCNKIYVTGWGGGPNLDDQLAVNPTTSVIGLETTPNGFKTFTIGHDFYILVLKPDAAGIDYGSFFGGDQSQEHVDGGTSRFDKRGIIYQSVCAGCGGFSDFPSTPNAWSPINRGVRPNGTPTGCNNAVFKMDFEFKGVIADYKRTLSTCIHDTIFFENRSFYANTYVWNFGDGSPVENTTNVSHVYTTPGTYQVTLYATNPNTCNVTDSITKEVVIYPLGTIILPDTVVCFGDTTQIGIEPLPKATYLWTPGTGLSDSTIANPFLYSADNTDYSIEVRGGGCIGTYKLKIKREGVVAEFTKSPTYCQNEPVYFTNSSLGADSYTWKFGDTSQSNDTNTSHVYADSGSYTVTLYAYGPPSQVCPTEDSTQQQLTIHYQGKKMLPDKTFCSGQDTLELGEDSIPGSTYRWSPTSGLSNPSVSNPLVYPFEGNTYTRIITDEFGCEDTSVFTLSKEDLDLVVSADSLVCKSTLPYRLTAYGGGTVKDFTWSANPDFSNPLNDSPTDSVIDVNVSQIQTFYVRGLTDKCVFVDSIRVIVLDGSTTPLPEKLLCYGDSAEIGFNTSLPDAKYKWQPNTNLSNDSIPNPVTTTTDSITYSLTIIANGCFQYFTQKINISSLDLELDSVLNICDSKAPIRLTANGHGTISSYRWSDFADFSNILNADTTDSTLTVTPPGTTTYYVSGSDGLCNYTDSTVIRANYFHLDLLDSFFMCLIDTVLITATNPLGKTLQYDWSPKPSIIGPSNRNFVSVMPLQSQLYTVKATDSVNCSVTDSILVTPSSIATITADIAYSDTIMYNNRPVELSGLPIGNYNYSWSPPQFATNPFERQTYYFFQDEIIVNLKISDGPCYKSDSIRLRFKEINCGPPDIFVPNAFTPNIDNNNDKLFVRGKYIKDLYFAIYDRWGEKVFETNDLKYGWDGTYKGKMLDPAVFVYYLEATCIDLERYFEKGNITLIK